MSQPQVDVLSLFTDLALDLAESSCFDERSQMLIQFNESIMIQYFVFRIESLVKLCGLAF